jgi:hypothetical protein
MAFDIGEDLTLFEIFLILVAVGGLGYGIWYLINKGGNDGTNPNKPTPLTSLVNDLGLGTSSLTQSDAISQEVSSPVTTLTTIVGGWWNDLTGDSEEY